MEAEISSYSDNFIKISLFHRLPLYIQHEVFKYGKDEEKLKKIRFKILRDFLEHSWMYERMNKRILGKKLKKFKIFFIINLCIQKSF